MFYPGCHVYLHDDICHIRLEGEVLRVHMRLSHLAFQESKTEVTSYEVKASSGKIIQALPGQLRFANGSPVCMKDGQEHLTGIITGSFDNPLKQHPNVSCDISQDQNKDEDSFFYSAQFQSLEKKPFFKHGIKPKNISFLFSSPDDTIDIALSKHERKIECSPQNVDEEEMSELSLSPVSDRFNKVVKNISFANYSELPNLDSTIDRQSTNSILVKNTHGGNERTISVEERSAYREVKIRKVDDDLETLSVCEEERQNKSRKTVNDTNRGNKNCLESTSLSELYVHDRSRRDLNRTNSTIGIKTEGRDAQSLRNERPFYNDDDGYHTNGEPIPIDGIDNKGQDTDSFTKAKRHFNSDVFNSFTKAKRHFNSDDNSFTKAKRHFNSDDNSFTKSKRHFNSDDNEYHFSGGPISEVRTRTKAKRHFNSDDNEYHFSGEPISEVRGRYMYKLLPAHIWSRMTVNERSAHNSGKTPVHILRLCPAKKVKRRKSNVSINNTTKPWQNPHAVNELRKGRSNDVHHL